MPDYSTEEVYRNTYRISETPKRFFVVGNQSNWLATFRQLFRYVTTVPRDELLSKGRREYELYTTRCQTNNTKDST